MSTPLPPAAHVVASHGRPMASVRDSGTGSWALRLLVGVLIAVLHVVSSGSSVRAVHVIAGVPPRMLTDAGVASRAVIVDGSVAPHLRETPSTMQAQTSRPTRAVADDREDDCPDDCDAPGCCTRPCHGTCPGVVGHCSALLAGVRASVALLSASGPARLLAHTALAPGRPGREPALRPPIA